VGVPSDTQLEGYDSEAVGGKALKIVLFISIRVKKLFHACFSS
jgi:hypothetical protein